MRQIIAAFALVLAAPSWALAYVDPGFLGSLYQLIYVFIFGTLAVWVMKPVQFIKSLFKGSKKQDTAEASEESDSK